MSKKQCSNVITATYTGKEQSPLRFGLSAEGYPINTVLEGFDKLPWIVVMKNSRKVWVRKMFDDKITYEEPVITNKIAVVESENIITNTIEDTTEVSSDTSQKKATDYNIFLSYRLKQLKEDNVDNINNKALFNQVMEEWKLLKNKPSELKIIIDKAKQENILSKSSSKNKKKPTVNKKDKIVEVPKPKPVVDEINENVEEVPKPNPVVDEINENAEVNKIIEVLKQVVEEINEIVEVPNQVNRIIDEIKTDKKSLKNNKKDKPIVEDKKPSKSKKKVVKVGKKDKPVK